MTQATQLPLISTARRGVVKRWTQTLIPTTRDAPSDAETPSHIFLVRAGYIRRVGAGIYDYLPLALRSLMKIADIVREEMEAAGASEMLMPALEPIELFEGTKRNIEYGDLLFQLEDRHGRKVALGPTHEEVITELMRLSVSSYKQLPLNLYQIQTKFRDEFRPRAGLLRCREFIMKDAYSFHTALDGDGGLDDAYQAMYRAYVNVFTRCGLRFTVVEAESGPIGGSASHEFMVDAPTGEDTILRCPASGYAANVEKCEIGPRESSFEGDPAGHLEEAHTPSMPGIHGVAEHLGVTPAQMLKTIVFQVIGTGGDSGSPPRWILACVRGDHEVNEGKVRDACGEKVILADEKLANQAGFAIGYVSPKIIDRVQNTTLLIDPDAGQGTFAWATGADKPDFHVKNFNWRREMGALLEDQSRVRVADIRNAEAGDPSPKDPSAKLEEGRGIEVGHIFKLGDKYSKAMGFEVMGENQKRTPVIMGCYGIGVSRTLAASVEQNHDDNGIVWPAPIAPYHAHIVVMKPDDEAQAKAAHDIAERLAGAGVDVFIDDRAERPGVKFKDADLIGLPIRLTVADKALAEGAVEFKRRTDEGKGELVPLDAVVERSVEALNT
ncbi:MAG: proline--tRNA ligase [Phycisphaerales bacterium]|nr:proline--tRNA ligase [Phycisphaerales bacterium]